MHIPPFYKRRTWQCFFIGIFFGSVISYCILLYMYGSMYENLYEHNLNLESRVLELKNQNDALLKDKRTSDEKEIQSMTIDKIEIYITNEQQLQLDRLIIHQLEEEIKKEINHIIGQDIMTISEADLLLQSTIENKRFTVDDFTYAFEIEKLTIAHIVKITLKAKLA